MLYSGVLGGTFFYSQNTELYSGSNCKISSCGKGLKAPIYRLVWHEALWATMRKYNINANIKRLFENLYDKAQSAVLFNGSTGD